MPASGFFTFATPLFKEERHTSFPTHRLYLVDPFCLHRARTRAALTTYDGQMNTAQISFCYGPEQGFKGNESDCGMHFSQFIDAIEVLCGLYAGTQPIVL